MKRPKDDGWRICPDVPETLLTILPREAKVVELGGGIGSPYLHHLFPNTTTIEHAQSWADYLREMGLTYMHLPLVDGWYQDSPELEAALSSADCLVVDGPPGRLRSRIRTRLSQVAPNCLVVWDDSQRTAMARLIQELVLGGWDLVAEVRDGKRTTTITRAPR